jgi:hypothetical protein
VSGGRPTIYTDEIAHYICTAIESGRNLQEIVEEDGMPCRHTVNRWVEKNPEFCSAYYRARRLQADFFADQILNIADETTSDYVDGKDGRTVNHEHINRSKLRVESRKWLMTRVSPEKWGDKVEKIHSGNPNNPVRVQTEVRYTIIDPKNPDSN